jgi:hypothetical protein
MTHLARVYIRNPELVRTVLCREQERNCFVSGRRRPVRLDGQGMTATGSIDGADYRRVRIGVGVEPDCAATRMVEAGENAQARVARTGQDDG